MKSLMVILCSMVMLFSVASTPMACDDMPLFLISVDDDLRTWESDEVYYNPKTDEITFLPRGSSNGYMTIKGEDALLECCDGVLWIKEGRLLFSPGIYKVDGFEVTVSMPFDTEKQRFVADREIMDAVAKTFGYGDGPDDLKSYYLKHINVISIIS